MTKKPRSPKTKKEKLKVPINDKKVHVILFRCTNCGEEDEKVLYCSHCDAPLEVAEVTKKDEEEVEHDDSLANNKSDDEDGGENDETDEEILTDGGLGVDELIEKGALGSIFGGDEVSLDGSEEDEGGLDFDDFANTLDE